MAVIADTAERVRAKLNFAADHSEDGVWSNFTPEIRTQKLEAVTVEFTDARNLEPPPSVEREGFELHRLPIGSYDWYDQDWIDRVYVPRSVEFIRELSGAQFVSPMVGGATLIRDSGKRDAVPVADFVHLDQSLQSVLPYVEQAADEETRKRFPRVMLYNLWRVMTPPPQDMPLALCDQRTADEHDWVIGRTVEPQVPDGVPYTASVYNPAQKWYFYPDVTPDDVIVFKQYDSRRDQPMGCLHGAFAYPAKLEGAVPRASMELRIFAFFEE